MKSQSEGEKKDEVGGLLVAEMLSGLLFWVVIITNIASGRFGYETFSDLDADAQLEKINNDQENRNRHRADSHRAHQHNLSCRNAVYCF